MNTVEKDYTSVKDNFYGTWSEEIANTISHKKKQTVIYVLKAGTNSYKIGKSINFWQRLLDIRTACPLPLEIIKLVPVKNHHSAERQLLSKFAHKRIHGEWFHLSKKDREFIVQLTTGR